MCTLSVYLVAIVALTFKVSIYRSVGEPVHGKYVVDGVNFRDKRYLRLNMNRLSSNCTTTCEVLGMLHAASNSPTVVL